MTSSAPVYYDDVVVGAGQAGCPLAISLAASGRKTALVERTYVGGTCINAGCTPTKTMLASARVAHMVRRTRDYGVDAGQHASINMIRVRQRQRDMVSSLRGGSEARLQKAGVVILRGEAAFTGPKTLEVSQMGGDKDGHEPDTKTTILADRIFLNVGERPRQPSLPGLDAVAGSRVLDSKSILELDAVPHHLVVVGGGYVGLEFAQLFLRLGAAVTVVQHGPQLLPRDDPDIAACLADILREEGMTVHLSTDVVSLSPSSSSSSPEKLPLAVRIAPAVTGGLHEAWYEDAEVNVIRASHILLAAGRTPNTERLNLGAACIKTTSRGYIVVDERLATSCPNVYALGDVHGGPAFTHMAYDDYRILKANLLLSPSAGSEQKGSSSIEPLSAPMTTATSVSRRLVPYVVYTDPQLGHVGLHERDVASALGQRGQHPVKTATMPMGCVERALETGEPRGIMKATVDTETGEILGFSCLGAEGGEIMAVVQAAMMGGVRWWDMEAAVWAHPSLAESLNNLWAFLK